jgi:hypothetical protein
MFPFNRPGRHLLRWSVACAIVAAAYWWFQPPTNAQLSAPQGRGGGQPSRGASPVAPQRISLDGHPPYTRIDDRIQLDTWSDPALGVIDDPMTEVVKIFNKSKDGWGTGTFLPECRVMTAVHVLLAIENGDALRDLDWDETLVGKRYNFETQPLPPNGDRAQGSFVVLAHGDFTGNDERQDWAIGYDPECLSEKLKLGYVRLTPLGMSFSFLRIQKNFTAGHSISDASRRDGKYHLYVDSNCHVADGPEPNTDRTSVLITNCSVTSGGSGQMLLSTWTENGQLEKGINGRAQKYGYGIAKRTARTDYREQIRDVVAGSGAGVFIVFTVTVVRDFDEFLTGPVDLPRITAGLNQSPFCGELRVRGREASHNFIWDDRNKRPATEPPALAFRGLSLTGEPSCRVSREPARIACSWPNSPAARQDFETIATAVKDCFPTYRSESLSGPDGVVALDQAVPGGAPGGPSAITARVDRSGTSMVLRTVLDDLPQRSRRPDLLRLCDDLRELVRNSSFDFQDSRGRQLFRVSDVAIPEPEACRVEATKPGRLACTWPALPPEETTRNFNRLVGAVQACFPTTRYTLSDGGRGGPATRFEKVIERTTTIPARTITALLTLETLGGGAMNMATVLDSIQANPAPAGR